MVLYSKFTYGSQFSEEKNGLEIRFLVPEISSKYKRSIFFETPCTLLTQIRVGRSHLNQHKFTIGLSDSPQCLCLHREESTLHYFVDCFLYSHERQILFSKIEHHIPNFKNYSKKKKIDLILRGYNPDNVEFTQLNTTLTFAVQRYIMQTKRFL